MSAYRYDPLLWPTLGSAAFIGAIALHLWRRRATTKGALPLALVALLLALWCLGGAGEVAATDVATQRAWFVLRDALTLPSVVLAFWFALEYAGLERVLTRPVVAVLAGATVAHVGLALVDGGALMWGGVWWNGAQVQGTRTPLGLAFAGAVVLLFLLSTAVFLLLFVRSPAHRAPVALILAGQLAIRVLYPLGVFAIAYVPNIVSGVVGLDCVAVMYAVALFRFRLFDLVPVARETILARIPDGLLVLDAGARIADANEAALRLLGRERRAVLGRPAAVALAAFPDLARSVVDAETPGEASYETGGGTRTCQVSSTPLSDWQGRPMGRLVLLHDITALRRIEAQLVEKERALAAVAERERLARELHDGLAQDLWLAKLKATRLAAQPELGPEARALAEEVTAAVDAGMAEAREAVATMRAAWETTGSLRELLSGALEDFEDRFGLAVEFDCCADLPALSSRAEAEALRVLREALTNVRRHADATVVRVRGGVDDGHLVLEVRDNGRGFDPGSVGGERFGLAGMRERAAQIGAEIEIESAPRKGTRVRLVVPVGAAPQVEAVPLEAAPS
ncbi:MAG: sensor histidine kinase [Candidatus Limnocylindrales bacterium]